MVLVGWAAYVYGASSFGLERQQLRPVTPLQSAAAPANGTILNPAWVAS